MSAKIIEIANTPSGSTIEDVFTDHIPLERLKEIWSEQANHYTDAQLYKIREFAYTLCEVLYKIINRRQPTIIELNNEPSIESKKSDTIRSREYRRAS